MKSTAVDAESARNFGLPALTIATESLVGTVVHDVAAAPGATTRRQRKTECDYEQDAHGLWHW
jgi:hypothetical protein